MRRMLHRHIYLSKVHESVLPPTGIAKQVGLLHSARHPSFYIGSQVIEFVDEWPHLGHVISNGLDDMDGILSNKICLIGQVNKILRNFRNVNCLTIRLDL
jgi:hypothetical protein